MASGPEHVERQPVPASLSGVERLYGTAAVEQFGAATVAVIGLGGVGSWVAEALVRSGIGGTAGSGRIVLMDLDDVCVTNTNRQAQATAAAVGRPKTEALAERLDAIVPGCRVDRLDAFFGTRTADALWDTQPGVVVDAIDRATGKALLIAQAMERGVGVVTVGGAGGKRDPAQVRTADVTRAFDDALLAATRKRLRQLYGFPRNPRKKFGVPCVFSPEPMRAPPCDTGESEGPRRLDCTTGYGSSLAVTGTFAFHAAELVLGGLAAGGDDS